MTIIELPATSQTHILRVIEQHHLIRPRRSGSPGHVIYLEVNSPLTPRHVLCYHRTFHGWQYTHYTYPLGLPRHDIFIHENFPKPPTYHTNFKFKIHEVPAPHPLPNTHFAIIELSTACNTRTKRIPQDFPDTSSSYSRTSQSLQNITPTSN